MLRKLLLFLICIGLCLLPFMLWGNGYLVGGDDTKLYYIFPQAFLRNYAFNVASENTLAGAMTGYASVAYFAPVFSVFAIAKLIPFVSTQMLFYGLTLSLGFFSFYKFLGLWIETKKHRDFSIKIIASLLYIFSPFIVQTLYMHQLLSLYLVAIVPVCCYLFIRGIRKNAIVYSILASLIFSVFSSTLNVMPWFLATCITLIPILFFEAKKHIRVFIVHTLTVLILSLLYNAFWLFHFINAALNTSQLGSQVAYYSSSQFVADNLRIVMGVSRLFSPLTVATQIVHSPPFTESVWVLFIAVIPFVMICVASIAAMMQKEKGYIYFIALLGFLLAWFLFSPNLGSFGPRGFLSLSIHIPFFTMFRNMYDKFSLSLGFYYAFIFAISLSLLFEKIQAKKVIIFLFSLVILSVCTITMHSFSQYKEKTRGQISFSGVFHEDYLALISYLSSLKNASHVLWLPLNGPTYANIEDALHKGHYYSGLSPLQELIGMPDYTGRFSFIRKNDLFYGDKLFTAIEQKQYNAVGAMLQEANVKYIVVDHQRLPESIASFMYGGKEKNILTMQGEAFKKNILGKKLKDVGKTYTVYEIHTRFDNDKIFLSNDNKKFVRSDAKISYKKINSSTYDVSLHAIRGEHSLFFLEPFDSRWNIYIKGLHDVKKVDTFTHSLLFHYMNEWSISKKDIVSLGKEYYTMNNDNSVDTVLRISFGPVAYSGIFYGISSITVLISILYCGYYFLVKKQTMSL